MNVLRTRNLWITTIGWWEVIGGVTGCVRTLLLWDTVDDTTLSVMLYVLVLCGCALSVLAGVALLRVWPSGRRLSLLIQGLQFLQFSFGWLSFVFVIGPRIGFLFGGTDSWWAGITALPAVHLHFGYWVPPYLGLNVFAAAAFIYLVGLPHASDSTPTVASAEKRTW